MPKFDASTIVAIASDIQVAVSTGKLLISDLEAFLQSKGADVTQLQANRTQLVADLNDLKNQLGNL